MVAGFARSVALFVGQVLVNLYLLDLGYSQTLVGGVVSVTAIGVGAGGIPAGVITARLGARKTMILNNVLAFAASVLQALAPSPTAVMLASFTIGFSNSVYSVASQPYLMSQTKAGKGGQVFSLDFGIRTGAGIAGGLLAGWLPLALAAVFGPVAPHLEKRYTLLIAAAAVVGAILPLMLIQDDDTERRSRTWLSDTGQILQRRNLGVFLRYGATIAVLAFAFGFVFPFYNLYLSQVFDASVQQIGTIMSLNQLAMMVGFFLMLLINRRVGAVALSTLLRVPILLLLVLLATAERVSVATAALVVANALFVMPIPITDGHALGLVTAGSRSMFVGLRMTTWNIFWALSSWLSGPLVERIGRAKPFFVTTVFLALYIVVFYALFRGDRSSRASVAEGKPCVDGSGLWHS
jgi:predicted MFS family arabinose efflux permease